MKVKSMPLYKHYKKTRRRAIMVSILYSYAFSPLIILMAIVLLFRIIFELLAELMERSEKQVERLFPFNALLEYFWNHENNALQALRIQIKAEKKRESK